MATISTRPLPHHFAGEWGPNQVADLEEDLIVTNEDLGLVATFAQTVSDRVDALTAAAAKPIAALPAGGAFWGTGGGEDGADGFPGGPGPMGPIGPMGVPAFFPTDGEDGIAWPGAVGATGAGGAPASSAPTTTGTETALALPVGTGPLTLYLNNATLLTVQGIAAGIADQLLFVFSKGAGQVDFAHLHASGTALGKLQLFATSGLTSLAAGVGVAVFQYDLAATVWRLVAHEQGAWITPAYNAGDFTASAGTWTVDAGDLPLFRYRLSGRRLLIQYSIELTTISTTPFSLNFAIPGGYLSLNQSVVASVVIYDNGAVGQGGKAFTAAGGGAVVKLTKLNDLAFAASTNVTSVYGTAEFEVQ